MPKNSAIFLAARSGSKRLPNKHFYEIVNDMKVIEFCILRLKTSKTVKRIFICSTKKNKDKLFKKISKKHSIEFFAGDEDNVLKRFIECAIKNNIKNIVRITADCPLIDPKIIDLVYHQHIKKNNDYTTNTLELTYPDGMDVEIIKLKALIRSHLLDQSSQNKEHVTKFIRESKFFKKSNIRFKKNISNRRWTLDNKKDLIFLKKIAKYFSPNYLFSINDILNLEKKNKKYMNLLKR